MPVDKATVRRIAHLARIGVEEAELDALEAELNNILAWVEQLSELDTEAVAPLASVNDEDLAWRSDQVSDGGYADDITANAPESHDGFFAVPKVIE